MRALLLFFLILTASAVAFEDIAVLNFVYENNQLYLRETAYLRGFYPLGVNQPSEGYRVAVIDGNEEVYSLNFKIPDYAFVDASDNEGGLSGGKIALKKAEFSLTVPFPPYADKIVIYDEKGNEVIETRQRQDSTYIILFSGILLAIIILAMILIKLIRPRPDSNW